MSTRTLIVANAIVAGLCMTLASGCSEEPPDTAKAPAAESPAQQATPPAPAPVPMPAPEVVERSDQGQLPSDFPSDIPVYPGAVSAQGLSIPGQGMLVTFTTVAASSDVAAFYQAELPKRGWTLEESGAEHRIVAHKDDREASIMIMASGAQTEIGVSVQGH